MARYSERQWAKGLIELLKTELPKKGVTEEELKEFFDNWKNNKDYVFQFQKPRPINSRSEKYIKSMIMAENKASEVLNQYLTQLIREQL